MRIGIDTIFEDPNNPTGVTNYLISLITSLSNIDKENQYFIFVSPKNKALFSHINQPNFTFVNCHFSNENLPLRILSQQIFIPYYAKKFSLDVVNSPGNILPSFLNTHSVLNIKTTHHYHTPKALSFLRRIYRKRMIWLSSKKADRIIANSTSTKNDLVHFLKVPENKIFIVFEAVDESFKPENDIPILKAKLLHDYNIKNDYILFVSSLWRYKNPDNLIRAFAKLQLIDYDLVIVGREQQPFKSELENLAKDLGVFNQVKFTGYIPNLNIRPLYCGAKVFVYPSFFETFGLTLVEAMKCGVPIVASNVGSIPEILDGAGSLVNPQNVDEIADAIHRVINNQSLRENLIVKGFERAKEFSWEKTSEATLQIFEETVKGTGKT